MKVDVKVNISRETGVKEITTNGIYSVNGYAKVNVDVQPTDLLYQTLLATTYGTEV